MSSFLKEIFLTEAEISVHSSTAVNMQIRPVRPVFRNIMKLQRGIVSSVTEGRRTNEQAIN